MSDWLRASNWSIVIEQLIAMIKIMQTADQWTVVKYWISKWTTKVWIDHTWIINQWIVSWLILNSTTGQRWLRSSIWLTEINLTSNWAIKLKHYCKSKNSLTETVWLILLKWSLISVAQYHLSLMTAAGTAEQGAGGGNIFRTLKS